MSHNIINKLIPFDDNYQFTFLEDSDIKITHPVSSYFLKLDDLSINLFISLKWIIWGHKFLILLSEELDNLENYSMHEIIPESLQNWNKEKEEEKKLIIDNELVNTHEEFEILLKDFYSLSIFDENTKVHLKLKLNLREYLIISSVLFPTFIKLKKYPMSHK